MTVTPRSVYRPSDFQEAVDLLARLGPEARPVAGGTDLLLQLRRGQMEARALVDLSGLGPEAREISVRSGWLHIGALVDFETIAASDAVARELQALHDAARIMGSLQVRCRGTIGGNLANASPAADSAPPLLAGGAVVTTLSPRGEAEIPMEALHTGPGRTSLAHGELITRIKVPIQPGRVSAFHRVGARAWHVITKASGALSCRLDGGRLVGVRLALGAVAPTVIRCPRAEEVLEGEVPGPEVLRRAGELAASEASPITDLRSTAPYRSRICGELVGILVEELLGRRP